MGEKLISKNHLTPALDYFLFGGSHTDEKIGR
jgi:hypothetical protein